MSAGNPEMLDYSKEIAEPRLAKHLEDSGKHTNARQQFGYTDTEMHTDVTAYDKTLKKVLYHDLKVVDGRNKSSGNYSIKKTYIQFVDPANPLLKGFVSKKPLGEKEFPEHFIKQHYTTFELYDENGDVRDEYVSVNSIEMMKMLPSVLADIKGNPNMENCVIVSLEKIKSLCHVRVI